VPADPADPSKGEKDLVNIDPGATKFILGTLDVFLMGQIYDNGSNVAQDSDTGEIAVRTRTNATNIDAVRYGLRGWERFPDTTGNDIAFTAEDRIMGGRKYKAVPDALLNRLGIRLIRELGSKIKEASEVSQDEEKNSARQSSP
jgi:hypothetical protein